MIDVDALADEITSAANIVTNGGFYEIDTDAVARCLMRALATAGAEAAELRAVLADRDALWKVLHDATCIIGHTVPMETVVLAGRKLVAREVWQAAHDLLYPKATRGTPHE